MSREVPTANETICEDCMSGDHVECSHQGGYMDDVDNSQRCGCHRFDHRFDNRPSQ